MSKIIIDLSGPDGNAFALRGYAKRFAKQLELDIDSILKDMQSGSYKHLLNVFEEHFGDYVTLIGRE